MSEQPKMRTAEDALKDPRPGDEVAGPVIKLRVVMMESNVAGLVAVTAAIAHREKAFDERFTRRFTRDQWQAFMTKNAEVLHVAQEGGAHE